MPAKKYDDRLVRQALECAAVESKDKSRRFLREDWRLSRGWSAAPSIAVFERGGVQMRFSSATSSYALPFTR